MIPKEYSVFVAKLKQSRCYEDDPEFYEKLQFFELMRELERPNAFHDLLANIFTFMHADEKDDTATL